MPTKILAIDDSKTMRLAIKITFAAEDADVTSVSKGSEAVARAKQMGADVVLVDANLAAGEPSGYEVCRALKSDPATANIPVILLVSGQTGVDQAQLTAVGGDDWLAKPFDTQELIDKVAAVRAKPVARPAGAAARPAAAAAPADEAEASQSGTSKRVRPQNRTQMGMPSPAAPPRPVSAQVPAATAPAAAAPAAAAQAAPAKPAAAAAAPTPAVGKPAISPASLAGKPAAATQAAPPPSTKPAAATPAPAAAAPVQKPAAAAAPAAAQKPAAAVAAKPAVAAAPAAGMARPGVAPGGPIPIAIPIPFTAADSPTPGMVERLRHAAAAGGVDPKVAEAIASLSREVIEAIVWEVVPELAESIIRQQQARSA